MIRLKQNIQENSSVVSPSLYFSVLPINKYRTHMHTPASAHMLFTSTASWPTDLGETFESLFDLVPALTHMTCARACMVVMFMTRLSFLVLGRMPTKILLSLLIQFCDCLSSGQLRWLWLFKVACICIIILFMSTLLCMSVLCCDSEGGSGLSSIAGQQVNSCCPPCE